MQNEIEQMAKDFCAVGIPCEECHLYKNRCHAKKYATRAYNNGYRKASEIFKEIEEMLNLQAKIVCETRAKYSETDKPLLSFIAMQDGRIYSLRVVEEHIAELKKKYTESEKDK